VFESIVGFMGRVNSFWAGCRDKSKQNKSGETEAALAALSCDKMLPTPCEKHESEIL